MTTYQEALKIILEAIPEPGSAEIPTKTSLQRVLAKDLSLTRDFPELRLSAVDGYAFHTGPQTWYQDIGNIAAGQASGLVLEQGQCAAVMTGAPVPEGTVCVVRIEQCEKVDDKVRAAIPFKPGDLINETGSEAGSGQHLLPKGTLLNKASYPTLFYAGIPKVTVYQLPRIGMLLTGDELCDVDETPARGQVFNTNCYILESFIGALGMSITKQLQIKDNEATTREALENLAGECDIVVSSGGVSMGKYDYIKKIFREDGYQLLIEGTKIKPGRPLMVARKRETLFFGMPGYPAAFLTNCLVYLVPALKKASGRSDCHTQYIKATLDTPLKAKKGRLDFNRIILKRDQGGWIASDASSQKTSHFLNFSRVNGLAMLPEDTGKLEAGTEIDCLHLDLELC